LNRATCYKNRSDEKTLSKAPPATKLPGERIIFDKLTPIAETTPFESSPPVVPSLPLQQEPTRVELPALPQFELSALLQFPGGVLNTQPPTVDKSPTQQCDALMPTAAGGGVYDLHKHDEDEVVLSSDDEEVVKSTCAASQFCLYQNNDTDDYHYCLNCNVKAHLICTKQMDFQTPALDKFVINHHDFSCGGKERYKKKTMLIVIKLYFVFCVKHECSRRKCIRQRSLEPLRVRKRARLDLRLCCCAIYESLLRIIVRPSFLLRWKRHQIKPNTQLLKRCFTAT
jgi:hypothetical protein